MADSTRLIDIYEHLKSKGVDVYFPTQKKGECTSPYVVVKEGNTTPLNDFTSTMTVFEILCYVPGSQYSKSRVYTDQIKEFMKGLWPMIVPLNYETPPFFDSLVKGHMISVQYRNVKYVPKGGN